MAGLTNPPGFGTNSFNEEKWSRAMSIQGPRFVVGGQTHWRPTISATADRTVSVAAGWGMACGVYDETSAAENVVFDPNTTASTRFDLLVARFDWTTNTRVFAVIKGGLDTPPISQTSTVDVSSVNRIAGLQYDAIIAVLQIRSNVGTFNASTDMWDVRVWNAGGGGLTANGGAFLHMMDIPDGGILQLPANGPAPRREMVRRDGNWRYVGDNVVVGDRLGREQLVHYHGLTVYQRDIDMKLATRNGGGWQLAQPVLLINNGDVSPNFLGSENYASTSFIWVPTLGNRIQFAGTGVLMDIQMYGNVQVLGDGWLRLVATDGVNTFYFPNSSGIHVQGGVEITAAISGYYAHLGTRDSSIFFEARASTPGSAHFRVPSISAIAT